MTHYPVNIREIQYKVSKKLNRNYIYQELPITYVNLNVKEIENRFGEKLVG